MNIKDLITKLKVAGLKTTRLLSRYSLIAFFIVFASMAGFLVIKIGELSRLEPTQSELDTKLSEIKKTKTDTDAINKLKQLEERNISIEALFDNGRINPFED